MLCPECGEVIAPGPFDLRRATHCASCAIDQPMGIFTRMWRGIKHMFRRSAAIDVVSGGTRQPETLATNKNNHNQGE